jgi:hypothetical protein
MVEKGEMEEEEAANEAQSREMETVMESRLGYLCDLGMISLVADNEYKLTDIGRIACMIQ